jgi:hypothetical protein
MKQVCALLVNLRKSKLGEMCSHASQAQIECVREFVANMMRGVSPDVSIANGGGFYANVLLQLACFATSQVPVGDMAEMEVLVGRPAVAHQMESMKSKMAKSPDTVQLMELETFQSFKWLLQDDEKRLLAEWVKATLHRAAGKVSSMCASSSSSASSSSASGSSTIKKETKDKKLNVMSFFG